MKRDVTGRVARVTGRAASSSWISPSPPADGGEGWREEVRFYWFPLSSVLSPLVPRGERLKSLMQPWGNRRASVYPIDRAAKTENLDGHGRRFIAQSSTGRRVETAATDALAKNQKVFCPCGRGGP